MISSGFRRLGMTLLLEDKAGLSESWFWFRVSRGASMFDIIVCWKGDQHFGH